jgi:hypothetical protein
MTAASSGWPSRSSRRAPQGAGETGTEYGKGESGPCENPPGCHGLLQEAGEEKSEITEDDLKNVEKDLQKLTDDSVREIDKLTEKKEKELFEI